MGALIHSTVNPLAPLHHPSPSCTRASYLFLIEKENVSLEEIQSKIIIKPKWIGERPVYNLCFSESNRLKDQPSLPPFFFFYHSRGSRFFLSFLPKIQTNDDGGMRRILTRFFLGLGEMLFFFCVLKKATGRLDFKLRIGFLLLRKRDAIY